MAHLKFLTSLYDLEGRKVADIGAGDGTFSRQLNQEGAIVTAVEIDPEMVERTAAMLPSSMEMKVGRAEELPFESNSMNLLCFFFSFHHVPINVQDRAINEVSRVLKPDGRLHVVEPFPYGSMFDVVRLVEDETEVRTNSHKVMDSLTDRSGFELVARSDYVLTREYPDFENLVNKIVSKDPERSARFQSVKKSMEQTYDRVICEEDGKRVLHQPCAAYHFRVSG
ncbi:MAG: class I SAM-dependent methyltransferase [Rhizobiaceae bacterium]